MFIADAQRGGKQSSETTAIRRRENIARPILKEKDRKGNGRSWDPFPFSPSRRSARYSLPAFLRSILVRRAWQACHLPFTAPRARIFVRNAGLFSFAQTQ